METCSYCGSEVKTIEPGELYHCEFCLMDIVEEDTQEDSTRKTYSFRDIVTLKELNQPTVDLMSYHTYELLTLLRLVRKERSDLYNSMNVFYKARLAGSKDYEGVEKEQAIEYQYFTKKAWVIENILMQRLGYIPERITDVFLAKYRKDCMKSLKPMTIRQERKSESIRRDSYTIHR